MPKQTIEIDSRILGPFRQIAGVLGESVHELVEEELERRAREVEEMMLDEIGWTIFC
jgi:hypothetical protein